ncbi:MAG: metallophosphoesterase [Fibrobacteres bacterium]|nr:metallophosphoesterase [Fibrobacterota bacterium]
MVKALFLLMISIPLFSATPLFKFVAIADLHCGIDAHVEKMRNFFETSYQRDNPDFFVALGDLSGDVPTMLPRLANVFEHAPAKVYAVSGNHDDAYANHPEYFTNALGPLEYGFDHKGIHFFVWWSQAYKYVNMKADFDKVPLTTPIILFQHYQIESGEYPSLQNRSNLMTVLHGHEHYARNYVVPNTAVQVYGLPNLTGGYYLCTVMSDGSVTYLHKTFQNDIIPADSAPVVTITQKPVAPLSGSVTFRGTAHDDGKVVKVEYCVDAPAKLVWKPVEGTNDWSVTVNTREIGNGTRKFLFRAIDSTGRETVYYAAFTANVVNEPQGITLAMDKSSYAAGDSVAVNFVNGTGWPKDWFGIFPVNAPDSEEYCIARRYTDNTPNYGNYGWVSGKINFTGMPSGAYEVRMFENDKWVKIASCPFEVSGSVLASGAEFVRTDTLTKGTWKGVYGNAGYVLPGNDTLLPSFINLKTNKVQTSITIDTTTDVRALQKVNGDTAKRIVSFWHGGSGPVFEVSVSITDGKVHAMSFYVIDWSLTGNPKFQRIEILDSATGIILATREISKYKGGKYLNWKIYGKVKFRFVNIYPAYGENVSGIFFGSETVSMTSAETFQANLKCKSAVAPLLAVSPNPLRSKAIFTVGVSDGATLSVYSLSGRLLRSWSNGETATPYQIVWDGSDVNGKILAAGVYVARLSTKTKNVALPLVLKK